MLSPFNIFQKPEDVNPYIDDNEKLILPICDNIVFALGKILDPFEVDLAYYGIDFEYKLRDFHDRCIKTDTGWTITLGRGLDMFEKYNTFSIASSRQDMRKCKDFMVTFMKE